MAGKTISLVTTPVEVIPAVRSASVQPPNPMATVSFFWKLRLKSGDFSCRVAKASEQLAAFVEILLAGARTCGDDIVCADVQSSRFVG